MRDRRRHPRYPATWRLRLWFGELGFADARAENVSLSGIGIALPSATTAATLLKPGKTIGVEVYDADEPLFRTTAAVRHCTGTAVGVECMDLLPTELFDRLTTA
ncbi:MAG: PilZ domain-containing protein [Candidatus Rokubacteria bacterium]|nr:PilZ domain-containing protein [Candidatus Rokubacteria bacterium]